MRLAARPVGFRSPSWDFTATTLELLERERFSYSSNFMDDLDCYVHPGTALVELPVHWILDDAPFFLFGLGVNTRPIQPASHALEIWKEEFDGLYERGGVPYVMTMHPQFIGRPSRLRALAELIRFIKDHDEIWFATCREIADVARAQLCR
jgi:peptidoglycan/xylan/chitin deacetylase (PgdA/CDA1 family)